MVRQGTTALVVTTLLLNGCAAVLTWEPDTYTVQKGDTLYAIAWRFDLDQRDLAAWNGLGSGHLIYPGQEISLTPPAGNRVASTRKQERRTPPSPTPAPGPARNVKRAPVAPAEWVWPTAGQLTSRYGDGALGGNGVDIAGRSGQEVFAASGGEVVYSGSGLIGYGKLIIIKHSEAYLSAYGHNAELLVLEGTRVSKGQKIAQMGEGPGKKPVLHFEIRLDGKPVDPLRYLPKR
jgi:lipoprotein NlpD